MHGDISACNNQTLQCTLKVTWAEIASRQMPLLHHTCLQCTLDTHIFRWIILPLLPITGRAVSHGRGSRVSTHQPRQEGWSHPAAHLLSFRTLQQDGKGWERLLCRAAQAGLVYSHFHFSHLPSRPWFSYTCRLLACVGNIIPPHIVSRNFTIAYLHSYLCIHPLCPSCMYWYMYML